MWKIRFLKQSKNDKKMLVFSLLRLSAVWWRLLCAEHRLLHCSRQQQSISDPVQYRVRRSSHCYNVEILKFCLVEIDWICFGGGRGCWDSFFFMNIVFIQPKGALVINRPHVDQFWVGIWICSTNQI